MNSKIVVVGSINVDLVIHSDRIPNSGETIRGNGFQVIPGGKGANQAVAAARQNIATSFIGCVGDDDFGEARKQNLKDEKITVDFVSKIKNESTGVAMIIVEPNGNNRIILSPAANDRLTQENIKSAQRIIAEADILICQLETPVESVKKALETAKSNNTATILNPAPAVPLDVSILSLVDYLIPNETEASLLSGIRVNDLESAEKSVRILKNVCPGTIMITMGEHGVLTAADGKMEFNQAFDVEALDTTAAGDTFIGTLAAFLIQKEPLKEAVKKAMAAAAIAVTRIGAQTSIPNQKEVEFFFHQYK